MRIGVDIKAFKNGTTGISRYLRSILDQLQKLDQENEYLLFSCAPSDYEITNPRWRKVITEWKLPGILWQQVILPGLLSRHSVDVLWAPEQVCPVFLSRKIKVVSTVYDLTFLRFPQTCQASNRLIQKYLFPLTITRSQVLAPISDCIKHEVAQLYAKRSPGAKLHAVYCGAPDWLMPAWYDDSRRENFLFFPGNLEPRKNLELLIRALEQLRTNDGLVIPLHLAGPSGWKNRSLFSLLESSAVKDQVVHLGYLSDADLRLQYLTCKALIYPSLYEGFGLPVLEALALDCMVMTSQGTVMQEVAQECALYFDPEDPVSMANAIRQVYGAGFERRRFLDGRAAILRKFSWEESALGLLRIFDNIRKAS